MDLYGHQQPDSDLHRFFYIIIQAVYYVFCFRHETILDTPIDEVPLSLPLLYFFFLFFSLFSLHSLSFFFPLFSLFILHLFGVVMSVQHGAVWSEMS